MVRYILALTLLLGSTLPRHQLQAEQLEFDLLAEKRSYFAYEPLVLTAALTNKGQHPIPGEFDCFNFGCKGFTSLYKKRAEREFKQYYSAIIWRASISHIMRLGEKPMLQPGSRVSTREMVLFDYQPILNQENKFVFNGPGEYEFKATFHYILENPSKVIESNILRLTVVNPPEEEQAALTWWKDKDLALVVQGDSLSTEGVSKLRAFMQQFPQSLYATAVRDSSERLKSYLSQKAKEKKLTEDEKELYERLHPND